jgi:hypothetical protein
MSRVWGSVPLLELISQRSLMCCGCRVVFECFVNVSPTWLTPCSQILPENPPVAQLLKNFQTFNGTRRFITVFTRIRHWSLSWASPIHTTPFYSLRSILILSSHLRVGLPSDIIPSGFPTKILHAFFFSSMHATCPAHLIILDMVITVIFGEE